MIPTEAEGVPASGGAGQAGSWHISCQNCGSIFPSEGFPFRCPACDGLYALIIGPGPQLEVGSSTERLGIERFQESFPLPPECAFTSLGEGGTPLVPALVDGRRVYFKCEFQNPTGSFKDRGTAVLVSALVAAGVRQAVEDSSGNAGASFSAYAARAGIAARLFVPEYAAGPKRHQISSYGAQVVPVPGPRSAATREALRAARDGAIYASHANLPHGQAGMATLAYEVVEQLGRAPAAVIMPVGQGTLLLGVLAGFRALLKSKHIDSLPRLVAVQARACAPIWAVSTRGAAGLTSVREQKTVAEGVRIAQPLRGDVILSALEETHGMVLAVEEAEILRGRVQLSQIGFYVEPTSAIVWSALEVALGDLQDPVVVILTGSGLKDPRQISA